MCQLVFLLSITCQSLFFTLRILYSIFAAEIKTNRQNKNEMKKRTTIAIMAITLCTGMQAQTRTVTLYNDDLTTQGPHFEVPTINYDDKTVTISADTLINNATVVIKDAEGNVIHEEQTIVTPAEKNINLPQSGQREKSVVELYYDDKCLYGYFDEDKK